MTQPLHIVIDIGVLFNIGVGLWNVGFRLVVVVIGDEIAHCVVGHELAELGAQLCSERLVRLDDERRALQPFDQPCGGSRFAGSRSAHKHHIVLTVFDTGGQLLNGLRLVSRWPIW